MLDLLTLDGVDKWGGGIVDIVDKRPQFMGVVKEDMHTMV